mgnify:CR=1 FL=1
MQVRRAGHAPRERVSWNCCLSIPTPVLIRHAPRERVSWNLQAILPTAIQIGHAPRERVSWNCLSKRCCAYLAVTLHVSVWVEIAPNGFAAVRRWSRSTWACELKYLVSCLFFLSCRHAPRERVSWNNRNRIFRGGKSVTLHVSVWVEMQNGLQASRIKKSRSTWACELKWQKLRKNLQRKRSRSTWACELKFTPFNRLQRGSLSRSTWACELKCLSPAWVAVAKCHAPRERVSWNWWW